MNGMDYYLNVFKNNYANFEGRARRSEFWYFGLFNMLAAIVAMALDGVLGSSPFLYFGYALIALIPGLAVGVRRLHDTNRSGWMLLIALIPLIGTILLIVWYCQDSDLESNTYGNNPKNDHDDELVDHLIDNL